MVTRGTFKSKEQTYEPKFVISIKKFGNEIGVTFFDVTTLEIRVGQFNDDESLSLLRTLASQIRPVEVIHEKELSNTDVTKLFKNSPMVPTFNILPPKNCWSFIKTCTNLEKHLGSPESWPAPLKEIKDQEKDLAVQSFGMAMAFLEEALIDEQTIKPAHYELYEPESK